MPHIIYPESATAVLDLTKPPFCAVPDGKTDCTKALIKAIDFVTGEPVQIPKGYKFELFLFDAFSGLDDLGIFRIEREEEFAPVKNPTGIDSAESAREMYMKIHKEEA